MRTSFPIFFLFVFLFLSAQESFCAAIGEPLPEEASLTVVGLCRNVSFQACQQKLAATTEKYARKKLERKCAEIPAPPQGEISCSTTCSPSEPNPETPDTSVSCTANCQGFCAV